MMMDDVDKCLAKWDSFCLYGGPGTGKSYSLSKIHEKLKGQVIYTALSNVACCNIEHKLKNKDAHVKNLTQLLSNEYRSQETVLTELLEKYKWIVVDDDH